VIEVEPNKEYVTDSMGFFKTDTLSKGYYTLRIESERYIKQNKTVKIIESKGQTGTTDIKLDVLLFTIASDVDQMKGQMAVKYFFPNHSNVSIEVCDPSGKTVRSVYDWSHAGGMRTFLWDGADNKGKMLPAGTYTCKFKSGNLFTSRTLVWNGTPKK
jgi:flagellar hook assembly protein FlgD